MQSLLSPILSAQDLPRIRRELARSGYASCEYTAVNLYAYAEAIDTRWLEDNSHLYFSNARQGILYPCAEQPIPPEELRGVSAQIQQEGRNGNFLKVPLHYPALFPDTERFFTILPMPEDCTEYLCSAEKLAHMKGREFSNHRNKIAQFKKQVSSWHLEQVTAVNYGRVAECCRRWETAYLARCQARTDSEHWERSALHRTEEAFEALKLEGLMVITEQQAIGFTLYSRLNDSTFDIHFKKNLPGYPGLSSLLFQETAKVLCPRAPWINIEDDLGLPGLRSEKQLLQPDRLLTFLSLIPR